MQRLLDEWKGASWRSVISSIGDGKDVPVEAVVAVARALVRAGAMNEAWKLAELITDCVASGVWRHISRWGEVAARHREDISRDVLHMLIENVLSIEPRSEFWECRFWTCFDRRVNTILRDFCRGSRDDIEWDDVAERSAQLSSTLAQPSAGRLVDRLAARDALRMLPEPLRTAFYLKHYCGYKEESSDSEPTIATVLGVTGRSVRNYLRRAEERLAEWRAEEEKQ